MIQRAMLALLLALALPAVAGAQAIEDYDYEDLSFRGIGFDYGYIWPSKVKPTSAFTVRLDLGFLGPNVRIVPTISYWGSELDEDELGRLADQLSGLEPLESRAIRISASELGKIEWSNLSLGVDAQYIQTLVPAVQGYLGAGLGVHIFNGSGQVIDDTFVEDLLDTITAGVSASAGVEAAPFERFRVYLEGRYTLLSDVRYPGLHVGFAVLIPNSQ